MADLRPRLAGNRIRQPCRVRTGGEGSNDLDAIAVAQLRAQGHRFEIDAAGDAAIADVSMHRVGEIDGRRPTRQRQDLATRREHVNLARKQVDLDVFQKLGGIARGRLQFKQ